MDQGELSPQDGPDDMSRAFFDGRTPPRRQHRLRIQSGEHRSPPSLAEDVGPVIYAVRTTDGLIKIGHTAHLNNRMRSFGGLKHLLALKPGTRADELAIHASLDGHAHHGREYYNPDPEVLAVVNDMRAAHGFAPITN